MKHKLIALILALTAVSWAQTTTQTSPSTPQQSTVPAAKACPCCDKMASASGKDSASCTGKDKAACCSGKMAMSCKRNSKTGENDKDKTAVASGCGETCGKDCVKACSAGKPGEKAASSCCAGQCAEHMAGHASMGANN